MEKLLNLEIPIRCIISGESNSGKSTLLFKLLFKIINDFDKINIYSPTIHQLNYQKIIKCFQSFLPLNIIDNILEDDISLEELDGVIEVIITDEDFVSSEVEIEAYDNLNELKNATEYDFEKHNVIILVGKLYIKNHIWKYRHIRIIQHFETNICLFFANV